VIAIVTGGTGFLGRRVVTRLRNEGFQVFVPRHNEYDLRSAADVARMYDDCPGADVMIHCAANVGGIGYNAQCPAQLFTDNLLMGVHVLDGAWVAGVPKFVGWENYALVFNDPDFWNATRNTLLITVNEITKVGVTKRDRGSPVALQVDIDATEVTRVQVQGHSVDGW
jgi:nucleoside-diphosphate-sugar epimerase